MKQKNNLYSKDSDDDKLDKYSKKPLNKKDYLKKISKVKSKYMQDYKNSKKSSKYIEEKNFNNLLTTYFQDYKNLKSKYKFNDDEKLKNIKYEYEEKDFKIKQQNLNRIISGNLNDTKDFNFDLCDNLINDLPKGDNNSLLKTIQNKEDYELRLQGFPRIKKNEIPVPEENEENNNNNNSKINENIQSNNKSKNDNNKSEKLESFVYIEDSMQFKEDNDNYLKLIQQNLDEELPLFDNIISKDYNKDYKVPFYAHDKIEKEKEKEKVIEKEKEIEIEKEIEKKETYVNNEKKEDEIDINTLILENKNTEYMKFENIIQSDFDKDYKIPEYKIPNKIKEEIEKSQREEESKKIIYENNINNNLNLYLNDEKQDENINKIVSDIIKNNEGDLEEIQTDENEKQKEMDKAKIPESENKINNSNNNIDSQDGQFEEINVDELKDNEDGDDNNYNDFEK